MRHNLIRTRFDSVAPPFDGNWLFTVSESRTEEGEDGPCSMSANHDANPGDGQGFGYLDGRNAGQFAAGFGDAPVAQPYAPIGFWGYQHKYRISKEANQLSALFDVLSVEFLQHGLEHGGSFGLWASILQLHIIDDLDHAKYPVLHAAMEPVGVATTGEIGVSLEAKLSDELGISNPREEYAFRVGWVVQIRYESRQNPEVRVDSFWRNVWRQVLANEEDQVGQVDNPVERSSGAQNAPDGFIVRGKRVGA